MRRPVRFSVLAIFAVIVLLSLQFDVAAQKRRAKHKKRARVAPTMVIAPSSDAIASSPGDMAGDNIVNTAPPAQVKPSVGGGIHVDNTDPSVGGKRSRGIGPIIPVAGTLLISEFRLRGPVSVNDEFIEIYNNSGADHTVASISGTGYAIAASDGVVRCTIPNATVIPAAGHFLCVNTSGFSLAAYRSGAGTIAFGDAQYTSVTGGEIPDNAGIALFNNNTGGASFSLANRFDAVGSTSEANTLYKEGAGYAALAPIFMDYAWVRDECGKNGAVNTLGACTISTPKDTDDNASDFYFVDTNGTSAGGGQRLGAPGPQGLTSPIQRNSTISSKLLDFTVPVGSAPNRVRDFTSVPANNSTFGTLSIRRVFLNSTGAPVTRLRFRIIDLDTFPAASGFADLRPITSGAVVVAGINDSVTCQLTGTPSLPPCTVTVQGTHLEGNGVGEVPNQPNGGGFNSSYSADTITLGTPLANGASINLQFLVGIQQTGNFRIYVNIEALP